MWLMAECGVVAHSTSQVSLQDVIHYLLITKWFLNGLEVELYGITLRSSFVVVGF